MTINDWWKKNTKREKILIMVTLPLLILIVAQLTLIQPMEAKQKTFNKNIQASGVELDQFTQQIETTQQLLAVSSKVKLQNQQKSLQQQILKQKELLSELTDNLIPPEQMATVIEKLLKQRGKLKLVSLINMESEGLVNEDEKQPIDNSPAATGKKTAVIVEATPLIYRHPLEIKLTGNYFQVMDYLKLLENSEYNFYWEQFDYKVEKYPQAEVLIKISTLGTESQWMGASSNNESN